jgi:hypothetical protein
MENGTVALLIAAGALCLNLFLALKGGAWGMSDRLTQMETRIMAAVAAHKTSMDTEVDAVRAEMRAAVAQCDGIRGELRAAIETTERRFGETVEAVRKHVGQIEIYIRDHYVRRESFLAYIQETRDVVKTTADRIENRLERMETKLDDAKNAATRRGTE